MTNPIEIDEMQRQISKEAGMAEDGGVSVPQVTDGITRYPQDGGGGVIPADDVARIEGEVLKGSDEKPKTKGEWKWRQVETLLMQ